MSVCCGHLLWYHVTVDPIFSHAAMVWTAPAGALGDAPEGPEITAFATLFLDRFEARQHAPIQDRRCPRPGHRRGAHQRAIMRQSSLAGTSTCLS
jgi:hypothetical protein